ncbi:aminotransferase class IV, partial [Rhodococcus sp. 7Tela_A2]
MADRVLMTLDGEVRDLDAPLVHADDIGVLRGDGVFETLLVRGGRACAMELHLARLASSAEALALPEPDRAEWRAAVDLAVEKWGGDRE